ncbi:putative Latent-transforming growth factor beta-binding [Cardiosporidium cionae]|uniref:Latent-transforming growth factor beta-binding n=1 Tax=Cardiosporidium cionae TaxID=476202 RepID=A0ABQ7JAD4_9APIC|nr:putative Latent-transforming growth factor beta-binding [Cardiosporidium cionae]|eukprot:KAF8820944.1 putative Latent-transforming growth factor beta-binding [Cardiosporidium cionae]
MLLPPITEAQNTGGLLSNRLGNSRNGRAASSSNNASALLPTAPSAEPELLQNAGNAVVAFSRLATCDPSVRGLCCLAESFCHSLASCVTPTPFNSVLMLAASLPRCVCPSGYEGDGRNSGTGCKNINECATNVALCDHQCVDLSPGYTCACNSGYRLHSNGFSCIDVDECVEIPNSCSHNCSNLAGSFQCTCPSGYALGEDNKTCIDVDECSANHGKGPCEDLCVNTKGGYHCDCGIGFKLHPTILGRCIDRDECREGLAPEGRSACKTDGSQSCVNTHGSFICTCSSGYRSISTNASTDSRLANSTPSSHSTVSSVFEQPHGMSVASPNPPPTLSSFAFPSLPSTKSRLGNPLETHVGFFPTQRSLQLQKWANFFTGGRAFSNPLPSTTGLDATNSILSSISNKISTEQAWDGKTPYNPTTDSSKDLNSAILAGQSVIGLLSGLTTLYSSAKQLQGLVPSQTTASVPFSPSGVGLPFPTTGTASPVRTPPSSGKNNFETSAAPTSITSNPFIQGLNSALSTATNPLLGGTGGNAFASLGSVILDTNLSQLQFSPLTPIPSLTQKSFPWAQATTTTSSQSPSTRSGGPAASSLPSTPPSPPPLSTPEAPDISKKLSFQPSLFDWLVCEDINECEENLVSMNTTLSSPLCSSREHQCVNLPGSYECRCPDGFEYSTSARNCIEINECDPTRFPSPCAHHCKNTVGSYTCRSGYKLIENGQCEDIDECSDSALHKCKHSCINTPGSFHCGCAPGYALHADGIRCVDTDECAAHLNPCSHICTNMKGSFQCSCPDKMYLGNDNTTCIAYINCNEQPMACSGISDCRFDSTLNRFACTCPAGYDTNVSNDVTSCVDINECLVGSPPGIFPCKDTRRPCCSNKNGGARFYNGKIMVEILNI